MQATDHHHHQQQRRKVSGSGSRFAFPSVGVGVVGAPAGRREVARVVGVWRSVGLPGWTSAGLAGRPYLLLLEKKEPSFPENFGFQEPHGNRKDPLVPLFLPRDLFLVFLAGDRVQLLLDLSCGVATDPQSRFVRPRTRSFVSSLLFFSGSEVFRISRRFSAGFASGCLLHNI